MKSQQFLHKQKVVIIGGRGALSSGFMEFAENEGAEICILGQRRPDNELPFLKSDITDLNFMVHAAEWAKEKLGSIDTVINFAGTHHRPMDFTVDDFEWALEEYERVMKTNTSGAFITTMVFSKLMMKQGFGHIIHLCSNASRLSLYGSYAYNISKHGLDGLIKTAAAQLAPYGVRVNGIAPGTVETELNRDLLRNSSGEPSLRAASILAHTPTKKFSTVAGVVESLAALCMPQRHLTGNIIFCDDGYNIEGHSWPQGSKAVYDGPECLKNLLHAIKNEPDNPKENI